MRWIVGLAQIAEDAGDVDFFAGHRQFNRLGRAFVAHGQRDLLSRVALDHINGFVEAHLVGGLAVDLEDNVAGQHSRFVGGCARHGTNDSELIARLRIGADMDADAAELAFARLAELLVFFGVDIGGVRVEPFKAALNHVGDEFLFALLVHGRDVALTHFVQRIDHEADHFIVLVLLTGGGAIKNGGSEQRQRDDAQQPG